MIDPWDKNLYEDITLYTTDCPKCKVLEQKLKEKEIFFEISHDIHALMANGFKEAPILKINNIYYKFGDAIKWVNNEPNRHRPTGSTTKASEPTEDPLPDNIKIIQDESSLPSFQEVLSNVN